MALSKKIAIIFSFTCYFYITSCIAVQTIKISTSSLNSSAYIELTNNTPCYKQEKFKEINTIHRGAVDLHLICQAFNAANFAIQYEFVDAKDFKRAFVLVENSVTDMIAETVWENHITKKLWKSEPIYRKNEYELGLYTSEENAKKIKITALADIQKLSGVSRSTWLNDWELLTNLKLKKSYSVDSTEQMFKMAKYGRADFLLWPFSFHNKDLSHEILHVDDEDLQFYKLYPVNNVKLTMPYSRHYILSKATPNSEEIITALNKGIRQLRKKGLIRKTYIDSDFMSDRTKNWQVLSPAQ